MSAISQNRDLSARNMGSLITLAILSATLLGGVSASGQDAWMAILVSMVAAIPLVWMYARLAKLLPGMGLFDMASKLFGRVGGAIVSVLFMLYAMASCVLVLNNFSEFILMIELESTPHIVIMVLMLAVAAYLSWGGFSLIGRWSLIACAATLANLAFTIALALPEINLDHLRPVFNHGLGDISSDALSLGAVAFGETVLGLAAFGSLRQGASPYRAYLGAAGLGGCTLILAFLRNITLLGVPMFNVSIFPSYAAARILRFGSFWDHIESVVSFNLILMGITKMALCLSAASMGAASILRLKQCDRRKPLIPVALAILGASAAAFSSIQQVLEFLSIYRFVVLPFAVLLPAVLWIAAELGESKRKRTQAI